MKTVEDFRAGCLTLLGDAAGRRYSPSMLDMGLREALGVYGSFCPNKVPCMGVVTDVSGDTVTVGGLVPGDVLTVRNEAGEWLKHSEYRSGPKLFMTLEGYGAPVGERLALEVSVPHSIKGLDDAQTTTVPDVHGLCLAKGAAGYAMRIRARSVTEVFGKRPEDRAALMEQAGALELEFFRDLERFQSASLDPVPRGNFPI